MGALTYADLIGVDLGKLGNAVTDWKCVVDGLKRLMNDARSGLRKKSEGARWAGLNADVTREFVGKTAKEFADLHKEASSIWSVLDDAHSQLTEIQADVKSIVAQAQDDGLRLSDNFDGTVRFLYPHTPGDDGVRTQEQLDTQEAYANRVNRQLARAVEVDGIVKGALAKSHGGDPYNAGHAGYHSLAEVRADRATELASLGKDANPKQRAELRKIWDGLSPELRGRVWQENKDGLLAAGIMSPQYKWKPADVGSGKFHSRDPGLKDYLFQLEAGAMVEGGDLVGYDEGARELAHYLDGSGKPLDLDINRMWDEDPDGFRKAATENLSKHEDEWRKKALKAFEESGGRPVSIPVETKAEGYKHSDRDWYLAVGHGMVNHSGVVTVEPDAHGKPKVSLDYQVNVWDRFNWDDNTSFDIGGVTVTGEQMQRLHQTGLAQEYNMNGSTSLRHRDLSRPGG
ncbi:hypothetical protein ACFV2X_36895 [Streptomyces sp. NPDC059679]|uniref:hypothetical protein n=1 Tax=Streptomyces sp. NPDC059679 TaxID=3346903 RepID=UPI0036AA3582